MGLQEGKRIGLRVDWNASLRLALLWMPGMSTSIALTGGQEGPKCNTWNETTNCWAKKKSLKKTKGG